MWLAQATRPDIATITNMLASYQTVPTPTHIDAAKRVLAYLVHTKDKGISFHHTSSNDITTFINFPLKTSDWVAMSDANWGPQDQSRPHSNSHEKLHLFKSRSVSGHIVFNANGPVAWVSKRQKITAQSSAEAEIYATDEAVKNILHIQHLRRDLQYPDPYRPITIFNDNQACVVWAHKKTTKGLRHLQMRENGVRESIQNNRIRIRHIRGDINPADIFTKEDRDASHFHSIYEILRTDITNIHTKCLSISKHRSEGGINNVHT